MASVLSVVGSMIGASAQASPDLRGWPLAHEVPISSDEEGPVEGARPRYFTFGETGFFFLPEAEDSRRVRRVERYIGDSLETERLEPPAGVVWYWDGAWCSANGRWIFWRGEREGRPIVQVVLVDSLVQGVELPAVEAEDPAHAEGEGVLIAKNRLWLIGGYELPEPLQASFDPAVALGLQEVSWMDIIHPQHAAQLDGMAERIFLTLKQDTAEEAGRKAAAKVRALMQRPCQRIEADELEGLWRVRSLQGSPGHHYAYPFFKARIVNRDGALFFEKISGSQRRSGFFYKHKPDEWVFLGGATVNEEPQVTYSGISRGEMWPSDSFGTLYQLGKGHLLMILDVSWNGDYELYELRRP